MKSLFITGAGRGIGLATARHFARRGYFIGLFDLDEQSVSTARSSGDFPNACSGHCDVTDRASVEQALQFFAEESGGRMDVLVNNAGTLTHGAFEENDCADHDRMIDVNIRGLTHVAQAAFPFLKATPGATMVNLCSMSSVHGMPLLAVYSASKFYVNGLTEALSLEWQKHDIRVTSVKPPVVNTAMGQTVNAGYGGVRGRDLTPEDVALAIEVAVNGRKDGYLMGVPAKLWYVLDGVLPNRARRALTRRLIGSA